MTIHHVKTNGGADWTGTVTVFNSQGSTVTAEASAIVRPSDWDSAHNQFVTLSGNTAGVSTLSGTNIVFEGGNNVTLSGNGRTVVVSAGAAGAAGLSVGVSTGGNTAGDTGVFTGRVVFVGSDNITLSGSSNAGSATISLFGAAAVGGGITNIRVSAGTTSNLLSALTFADSNGIGFGINASTITASYTVPTQSNQTLGGYALGNTTGESSSSTYDARTLSVRGDGFISVGWSNGSLRISGTQTNPVVSNAIQSVGSATGSGTNTSRFAADDHVHAGVFSMGVSTGGNTAGDTRVDVGRFVLAGGNNVTLSQATAANAVNTISIVGPATAAQSVQTLEIFALGNTTGQSSRSTYDARTLSMEGAGFISVGWSNGSFRISGTQTNPVVSNAIQSVGSATGSGTNTSRFAADDHVHAGVFSVGVSTGGNTAGDTRVDVGRFVFAGGNNVTLSQATGANAVNTISIVGPNTAAQTNQTLGLYAVSNTTGQSSSSTFDARTISFHGAGIASVGYSGGSVVISVPAGGGAGDGGVFAGVSTGGNTAGSTGTVSTGNFVLVGSGVISLSQSTGAAGSAATVSILAPATSSLVGTNGISVSTAGSTISILPQWISSMEFPAVGPGAVANISSNSGSVSHAVAFRAPMPISASFLRLPVTMTATQTTYGTTGASLSASVEVRSTWNAVIYSLGTGASSKSLMSVASGSAGYTWRNSVSVAANGTQYSITQQITMPCEGGTTTHSTQYSSSQTNYSWTSLNAGSLFSGGRFIDIPFANSLSAGAYWLILGQSTSMATNSTGISLASACGVRYTQLAVANQINTAFGVMGSTNLTSGGLLAAGSFSTAGGGTTDAIPISAISSSASHQQVYFQLLRSA